MITLYGFGPAFGQPDPSPFVVKAMLLLKLAGLTYQENHRGYRTAPKGKLPYIDDDGVKVADSSFIRFHIEQKYRFDYDAGLSPEQRAAAWAVEKMLEDHFYWTMVDARWMIDANFNAGPAKYFDGAPAPLRPFIKMMIRRTVAKRLKAQGMGAHRRPEIEELARRDLAAVAALLGDKPYLMGDAPCGADATLYAFLSGTLVPIFQTPILDAARGHAALVAYVERGRAQWFPDVAPAGN